MKTTHRTDENIIAESYTPAIEDLATFVHKKMMTYADIHAIIAKERLENAALLAHLPQNLTNERIAPLAIGRVQAIVVVEQSLRTLHLLPEFGVGCGIIPLPR